ncbi:probable disease resistance protein At4g27220 [Dioscorea cayenensis subsp. rotundata]|uniref:Probable disease resistance protein At4g27220 n=1 Tax=Dioscorea cayennensis subsp. rotundata TaxID=55577 RepID=A0AB40CP64_DIOCR|nr:probable disease resistance protein At4g27220 [Dioscorea cayenensis subsp. rotundata]
MVTISQNIDLKRIQKEMAECLGFPLNEENVEVRAAKLAERLTRTKNKVLVILDDLWETLDLSKVGIRLSQMAATCKVVITTRNRDICKVMRCEEIVELETLSDDESWRLFASRAGDAVESPTMREWAQNIVKECAGLPLALVVLGTALKGKKPDIWKTVLMQIKRSMDVGLQGVSKQVFQSIKLSFDFLESEEAKSCFLHCCLYPEDYDIPKEELMHLMVGGGILIGDVSLNDAQGMVDLRLDQLKTRGLLLQGKDERFVKMHDVVRDVAMQIGAVADHAFYCRAGQGLKEWPRTTESEMRNCRRLSLMDNDIEDLPHDPMQYPKLEMLILRGNKWLSSIPAMFFLHMGCLMVLDLSYTAIKSLPESLSCLNNLRVLNLRRCYSLRDISHINGLKMLEILILDDCSVSIVPADVGCARSLRFVDLGFKEGRSSCLNIFFSKKLPRFHRLEQLFMGKFAGSFRELISLRHLTHIFIREVVDLGDSLSHELVSPGSWPDRLQDFSISFHQAQSLFCVRDRRNLKLMGTKRLAVWVKRLLEKTIHLTLAEFQETELSSIGVSLPSLECLEVFNRPYLTKLLGDELLLHEQIPLRQLITDNCPTLTSLIPSEKLDHISVMACPMMPELFPNLKRLEINDCGMRYVVSSKMETVAILADPFPALEILGIRYCPEMIGMISPPASLQAPCFSQRLREITIAACPRLTHLFSYKQAISMQHLIELSVINCAALEAVVISTENKEEASSSAHVADHESYNSPFPNLRILYLVNLPQLTAFHHPTAPPAEWLHLGSYDIDECPKLQEPLEERIRSLCARMKKKKAGSVKGEEDD